MTRPEAKQYEVKVVREFIRLHGVELDGEPLAGEGPDFELSLKGGARVGLEITELADPTIALGAAA